MPYVPLHRLFSKWRGDDDRGEDFDLFSRGFIGEVSWPELLKYQRVVVLAAAGSGKSEELKHEAKRLESAGEFAFHATVQNVAKEGLASAIGATSAARLVEWKASDTTAWFFIDSVDEAKLDHIRFSDAMRRLADGIGDGRPRARIILSGRYNNWEFRGDLERLMEALPMATEKPEPLESDGDPLIKILRNEGRERPKKSADEKPVVVLMAPLDKDRVRLFAEGQGVKNVDEFVQALDQANLWRLAQRPLDLDWLVAYWLKRGRFGNFALMLETSLKERLKESPTARGSRDAIDVEKAFAALERIGATMVFGREDRIELPDSQLNFASKPALKLADILEDWPGDHQERLLTRAVFDPASLGKVRLHNDNEGTVRGFLAAKWLHRRRQNNAPKARIFELLFGDADGAPIVLPSAQETAAWLAIWDEDVAREVVARDPVLLLTAGDPASLPLATRVLALEGYAAELAAGHKPDIILDRDVLQRFSTDDLVPHVRVVWDRYKHEKEVRRLVLSMVELGRLVQFADIAQEAVSGTYSDRTTLLFGARALAVTGDDEALQAQGARVKSSVASLDEAVVWEVLDLLFPKHLTVADLLAILNTLGKRGDRGKDFSWRGKGLVERLTDRAKLEELLHGLVHAAGPASDDEEDEEETPIERRLKPMIQGAASALIKLTPANENSDILIDAAVRLRDRDYGGGRFEDEDFYPQLVATPERRRKGLWRAVELLKGNRWLQRHGLSDTSQLEFIGWSAGLRVEDVPWLMEDAKSATSDLQRTLAINALLRLWRDTGSPAELFDMINEVAAAHPDTADIPKAWTTPRKLSPEEVQLNRKMAALKRRREAKQRKADQSWIDLIDKLKADPTALRTPPADLKKGNADARVFYLWRLLYASSPRENEYSIQDFGVLGDVLGPELTREVRAALKRFWRTHTPTLTSTRPADKRNQTHMFDSMGIAGVSMDAHDDPSWAIKLSGDEAIIAAALATQELNGFPRWLGSLVAAKADQVRAVFLGEVQDHLAVSPDQHGFVDKVAYAEPEVAALVVPALIDHLKQHDDLGEAALSKLLAVVMRAPPSNPGQKQELAELALARFAGVTAHSAASTYLGLAFRLQPEAAITALTTKLDILRPVEQRQLAERALPRVFGDRMFRAGISPRVLPFDVLERLVGIAFRTIRPADDNVHEGVFTPDNRDSAEDARGSMFAELRQRPGRPTIEALRRLAADPNVPIEPERIAAMIHQRASNDAEHEPWPAGEAQALEKEFDTAPRTPRDLQLVALGRIGDIDHDLHHHEFNQGQTVKTLPNEREVQKWVANEFRMRNGRAYSLTRESHVVDEKEPDIRLQSNDTDASLPIEIKVTESWSIGELEFALTGQLVGRYVREKDKRHGVLLLVHQKPRAQGWPDEDGRVLTFREVVERLKRKAYEMAGQGSDPPQAAIAVIDVSDIAIVPVGKKSLSRKQAARAA